MSANWNALTRYLNGGGDSVKLSWRELEDIVGGMPASAINHPAWWGGDRPHTRAWKAAGYQVAAKTPGVQVLFTRTASSRAHDAPRPQLPPAPGPDSASGARVILVSCAKQKADRPMAARDLYTSPRFRKARSYAEGSGQPWFILSAAHGLVAPNDWLAPYDLYLGDTSSSYRRAWGEWIAARMEQVLGGISGHVMEVHAGLDYLNPLVHPLQSRGAAVEQPLSGLRTGEILAWYDESPASIGTGWAFTGAVNDWISAVGSIEHASLAADLATASLPPRPGLYGWFVDASGAQDLSRGLDVEISPGLVYVGQTGATKWPTGTRSAATLQGRILRQHLRGRRSSSTLRRTFGAVLDSAFERPIGREELSAWMASHLRVATKPTDDPDTLGDLERQVVQILDPPLNLDHTETSPTRLRLRELRRNAPATLD